MLTFPVGAVFVGFMLGVLAASLVRRALDHRCVWCGKRLENLCSLECAQAEYEERHR